MAHIGQIVEKVRSKNAGPFWLTIDIFCGNGNAYDKVLNGLSSERLAATLKADAAKIKRFDMGSLHVVKFSLRRPQVQGSRFDTDMHGASWAALVGEMEIN